MGSSLGCAALGDQALERVFVDDGNAQLERPLHDLEALRVERHVALDGQLFAIDQPDDDPVVRQLGA